jgi:hypothetical protein
MKNIESYFNAEKQESLIFILIGFAGLIIATYFILKLTQPYFQGMSYPIIGIALIQLIVGSSVYFSSDKNIKRVNNLVENNVDLINTEEIPRMEKVMKNFVLYKTIEIVFIISAILLHFIFNDKPFLKGFGLGLLVQSGFMLLLDLFAEKRGKLYLEFLRNLT